MIIPVWLIIIIITVAGFFISISFFDNRISYLGNSKDFAIMIFFPIWLIVMLIALLIWRW